MTPGPDVRIELASGGTSSEGQVILQEGLRTPVTRRTAAEPRCEDELVPTLTDSLTQDGSEDPSRTQSRGGSHGSGKAFDTSFADAVRTTPEEQRRRTLAIECGYRGDERTARELLHDDSPKVRSGALGALVHMTRATPQDFAEALTDEAAQVRRSACELASKEVAEILLPLLDDPDPRVVEACAFALGECEVVAAVPALMRVVIEDSDPLCRETAVAALGNIGDDRARRTVIDALGDAVQIRRRALIALANFDGEDVRAAIQGRLTDRDWQVRQAAEDLLGINEETRS